jgi:IMP dehydrogenase/GMP reductase
VIQVGTAPAFASVGEAMDMVRAGLGYLAAADAPQLSAATQAECLRGLERADSVIIAARASILAGFAAGKGYADDADYSARSWLIHQTHITSGAAVGHTAWAKRVTTHPRVIAALAAEQVTESVGRLVCLWTNRLPEKFRDESDELLIAAAAGGLGLEELASLVAEMYERARGDLPDDDPDRDFADRALKLATTFGGAGVIHGDLTPECAEVVGRVLDALSAPAGKDDDRTRDQRYHDALAEAMRRLMAANLVPERAGQPVKAWVHLSLADLLLLDGDSALQDQWTAQVRQRWAACRAFASETGSEGGAWLDGDAAEGIACDAAMAPIVTGDLNVDALEDLVRLCVELDGRRRDGARDAAWAALEQAVIGKAVDLLSGPGGLASFLRRRQLGVRLAGPSLPLDIGYAETIPAGIRNAVTLRDRKCRFPGGCNQPASACEVHHTKHKANGGKTSTTDCVLLCFFHHQVVIHRWGWTLVLNPDGTTTAWNKDKTKLLHSHGPPARAG